MQEDMQLHNSEILPRDHFIQIHMKIADQAFIHAIISADSAGKGLFY
jgi:hypothetical protein